jgi:hypothetical protein
MADLFINPADGLLYNNVRAISEMQLTGLKLIYQSSVCYLSAPK